MIRIVPHWKRRVGYMLLFNSWRIDFRRWYYVTIDDELMPWWACECELDQVWEEFGVKDGKDVRFTPVPWWKRMFA
ncbi:hypothetical protein [Staphylospora marina]|uniref:hypothetical protein n=1 Tax=Staphylospora marina TaxID=2490858 RepID=UPI000F5BF0A6|nr:hypothetical protein [Staphylospora marina]